MFEPKFLLNRSKSNNIVRIRKCVFQLSTYQFNQISEYENAIVRGTFSNYFKNSLAVLMASDRIKGNSQYLKNYILRLCY